RHRPPVLREPHRYKRGPVGDQKQSRQKVRPAEMLPELSRRTDHVAWPGSRDSLGRWTTVHVFIIRKRLPAASAAEGIGLKSLSPLSVRGRVRGDGSRVKGPLRN